MPLDPRDRVPKHSADRPTVGRDRHPLRTLLVLGLVATAVVGLTVGALAVARPDRPFDGNRQLDDTGLVVSPKSVTVAASADAQIRSFFRSRNYGAGTRLRVRLKTSDNQRSLLRFTLPSLPAKVVSARLRLYVTNSSPSGGAIRTITGAWAESSVSWANAPALGATIGRIRSTGVAGHWITVPVLLRGLTSGATINLAIVGGSPNGAEYASRETSKRPRLVLTLGTSAPTSTPTAKPPTGRVYPVPASINATGSTDVSTALKNFVNTVPDGSTITFRPGTTYRLDKALQFSRHHNLTLDGNGATLKAGGGTSEVNSLIWVGSYGGANTDITIRNFNLVGNSTTLGVYQGGREGAHGILVEGSSNIDVSGVTVSGVWGDCFYVGGWADTVTFHDSTCRSNGRNGLTITSGRNVTAQRVAFGKSGYVTFDIEPNVSSEGASNIKFLDNTAGTWTDSFFSALGAAGSKIDGVTVSRNTVTGKSMLVHVGLNTRRTNFTVTNNAGRVAASGPILRFAHVDGLVITGNVQPLSSGSLASIVDCTRVTGP